MDLRLKRHSKRLQRQLRQLGRVKVPYWLDCAAALRVDPRDTLVVSGFRRTGTTWLQQSLAKMLRAKTVFEPLNCLTPMAQIYAPREWLSKRLPVRDLYMPYCPERALESDPLYEAFRSALQGDIPGRIVRTLRTGASESLRTRIVVKVVRGHLCLRALQKTFGTPVIHISRDPRAIAASIRLTDWAWLLDHLSLREQLLEVEDGRADFFNQWRDEILEADQRDGTVRMIVYWALTERFLRHRPADQKDSISFVAFEELCRNPETILRPILKKSGFGDISSDSFAMLRTDSFTTVEKRRSVSLDERLFGWKKVLTPSESDRIEMIARRLGCEDSLAA